MRLLKQHEDGTLSFTADLGRKDKIPPYVILSHTWGADEEEATFGDLESSSGEAEHKLKRFRLENNNDKAKPGYEKIRFCGAQAQEDGLQYFWIDTCCINKENKAELSQAIQSMFFWYRNAARCYVYLADVSSTLLGTDEDVGPPQWELDLRRSRWFTRGWTLQELLAPSIVEFFSQEGDKLGTKTTLAQCIHEITGVPITALQGASLSQFSVDERLLWKEYRHTKVPEDGAYSLLGIFDVYIAPLYGEGAEGAFRRLLKEIQETQECIRDIRNTDPRDDKKRIEETKGGLLADSYQWIFNNTNFKQWHNDPHNSRMLWVKGDPGKGKTMLLCGIINELQKTKTALVSYFFCQATDLRINSATAVLRGLLYVLVRQQPSLVSSIRKKYDQGGKAVFEDSNAWIILTEIFAEVLQDPNLETPTYLIIDALDECVTDLPRLLDFVATQSSASSRVKWIVSSRNWPEIEEKLGHAGHRVNLELNAKFISAAVHAFIRQRVTQLSQQKKYDTPTHDGVLNYLTLNANDTFLWVALVCQSLRGTAKRHVLKKLSAFPPGLGSLYERMLLQISKSDDAELCRQILGTVALVRRPLTLEELSALVEDLEGFADVEAMQEIISLCGSFLTLRHGTVYFVHQSAQDFLLNQAVKNVFPFGMEEIHSIVFFRSLEVIFKTLHRDMYGLKVLGFPIEDVRQPDPDPLAASRYSCVHWVDHLDMSSSAARTSALLDGGMVNKFLEKKYLYWLEALSLCKSMPEGMISMAKLQSLAPKNQELAKLVYDAYRFIMYHNTAIKHSPLQTYASALLFTPTGSLVRGLYSHEDPDWITVKQATYDSWSKCLQTFEDHGSYVSSVVFSHDSTLLASGSSDYTVKIWDVSSGGCLQTLKHKLLVFSVAFSHDSIWLASGSGHDVRIWDLSTGTCIQTLEGHSRNVTSVVFSNDSYKLVSGSDDETIKVWDTETMVCLRTLEGHSISVNSVAFTRKSIRVVSVSYDNTIEIWDAESGMCLQMAKETGSIRGPMTISHDSKMLASGSDDATIKIWDTEIMVCLRTLKGHNLHIGPMAFSHDSALLASGSDDYIVKIWDVSSGVCLHTFHEHSNRIFSLVFTHDSTKLASASDDGSIKIWDLSTGTYPQQALEGRVDDTNTSCISLLAFSPDSAWLASIARYDSGIKIWDVSNGLCLRILERHTHSVTSISFSHDSTRLASASLNEFIIWDTISWMCLHTEKNFGYIRSMAFSHDSTQLASTGTTNEIWSVKSGTKLSAELDSRGCQLPVIFSHHSDLLASISSASTIKMQSTKSGMVSRTIEKDGYIHSSIFLDSPDRLVIKSAYDVLKIWDLRGEVCVSEHRIRSLPPVLSSDFRKLIASKIFLIEGRDFRHLQYLDIDISSDRAWILHQGKRMIAIPQSHRGQCSAVDRNNIGIGYANGKVCIASLVGGAKEALI